VDTIPACAAPGKQCIKCKECKPLADFPVRCKKTGKRRNECRRCRTAEFLARYHANPAPFKARTVKWQKANPDKRAAIHRRTTEKNRERIRERNRDREVRPEVRQKRRAYKRANADRIKASAAEYRRRKAEAIKASGRAYYLAHKDEINARIKRAVAANPELYKQLHKAAKHRRRVRMENSGPVEQFTDREVFERDGWRCGLCGGAVNPALRHPDPLSASLDHRTPIAKGGGHTRANVQCAHLRCNLSKRDRETVAA
jgi:hypothetical protein